MKLPSLLVAVLFLALGATHVNANGRLIVTGSVYIEGETCKPARELWLDTLRHRNGVAPRLPDRPPVGGEVCREGGQIQSVTMKPIATALGHKAGIITVTFN